MLCYDRVSIRDKSPQAETVKHWIEWSSNILFTKVCKGFERLFAIDIGQFLQFMAASAVPFKSMMLIKSERQRESKKHMEWSSLHLSIKVWLVYRLTIELSRAHKRNQLLCDTYTFTLPTQHPHHPSVSISLHTN